MLNGFEVVLGRKFECGDCIYGIPNREYPNSLIDCKLYKTFYNIHKQRCKRFRLSDKTKFKIKIKDIEIGETKKETHPKYLIGKYHLIL
ncbi:MAG: hypothetical protein ACTSU2_17570 [Promethearchaeota archaeon]